MRIITAIILATIFTLNASAQDISLTPSIDSTSLRTLVFHHEETLSWQPTYLIPAALFDSTILRDFPTASLRSALLTQPLLADQKEKPWSLRPLGVDDKLRSFRIAIGYAEAGGSLYLAYRALKKQGFLK